MLRIGPRQIAEEDAIVQDTDGVMEGQGKETSEAIDDATDSAVAKYVLNLFLSNALPHVYRPTVAVRSSSA